MSWRARFRGVLRIPIPSVCNVETTDAARPLLSGRAIGDGNPCHSGGPQPSPDFRAAARAGPRRTCVSGARVPLRRSGMTQRGGAFEVAGRPMRSSCREGEAGVFRTLDLASFQVPARAEKTDRSSTNPSPSSAALLPLAGMSRRWGCRRLTSDVEALLAIRFGGTQNPRRGTPTLAHPARGRGGRCGSNAGSRRPSPQCSGRRGRSHERQPASPWRRSPPPCGEEPEVGVPALRFGS